MAAFIDYTTRDRGVLGYRGFERAVMNDPDMKTMVGLGIEMIQKFLNHSDLFQLESALRSNNTTLLASVLSLTNPKTALQKLNQTQSAIINFGNKYSEFQYNNFYSNYEDLVKALINKIRLVRENRPHSGGENDPHQINCNPRTQHTAYVFTLQSVNWAGLSLCLPSAYRVAAIPAYGEIAALGIVGLCILANTTWSATAHCVDNIIYTSADARPHFGGLD